WSEGSAVLNPDLDLGAQPVPAGSGGALVALHLWHRLLTGGPDAYGEVFCLGQLPDAEARMHDVLIGRFDSVEVRFLFDPDSGRLVALESWSDPEFDPCEITFDDFRDVGGVELPHQMLIQCGDFFQWRLQVSAIELGEGS
ncbi:MAG: hypothetical protein ACR2NP_10935, partial [Pirellulaceae bacterium]